MGKKHLPNRTTATSGQQQKWEEKVNKVFELTAKGCSNAEIALRLNTSVHIVRLIKSGRRS